MATDNQEIAGVLNDEGIIEQDLISGRFDAASVQIWLVNWQSPDQRHHLRTALLGEIVREDNAFRAELRGITSLLDKNIGRSYTRRCDANLGDDRCRADLENSTWRSSGHVTRVVGRLELSVTGLGGFEPGFFAGGYLQWTGGPNLGRRSELSASPATAEDRLSLWQAPIADVGVGDTFNIYAGCDKTFATCRDRFGNQLNFRGCPHLPGRDFAMSYANGNVVHDGSPLIS